MSDIAMITKSKFSYQTLVFSLLTRAWGKDYAPSPTLSSLLLCLRSCGLHCYGSASALGPGVGWGMGG